MAGIQEPPRTVESQIIDVIAAWDHAAWAGWTRYLLDNYTPENITRWCRQIDTPFAALSESEQELDRQEARSLLDALMKADMVVCFYAKESDR